VYTDLRESLSTSSHGLYDHIRVLHEHGDSGMLHRRRFDKTHGVHSVEGAINLGLGRHVMEYSNATVVVKGDGAERCAQTFAGTKKS
jgi:hypothetical protein